MARWQGLAWELYDVAPRMLKKGQKQKHLFVQPLDMTSITKTADTTYDNDDLDDAIFRSFLRFLRSFVRFFVRSKIFQKIGRVAAMILVQNSSKSELSSRFFGRLKIFGFFIFRRWCPGGGVSGSGEKCHFSSPCLYIQHLF